MTCEVGVGGAKGFFCIRKSGTPTRDLLGDGGKKSSTCMEIAPRAMLVIPLKIANQSKP